MLREINLKSEVIKDLIETLGFSGEEIAKRTRFR